MAASACKFWFSRDRYNSESATTFLVRHDTMACIEAPVDLDSLPLLRLAHIIDSYVVELTPEEWNSVKLFTTAKNIFSCCFPIRSATTQCSTRIRAPVFGSGQRRGIAGSEDSGHAGFEIFIDCDTPINREPGLLGQSQ
jgi:hypothetical protein